METVHVEVPHQGDEWAGFVGRALDDKVRELDVAARQIEASIVAATEHVERTAHFQVDGHRSPSGWLMATTNCTRGEATGRVRSSRLLHDLTKVAAEFFAGRIGIPQVREIARLAANPRAGDQVEGSEDVLLQAAQTLEWSDFRVVTKRWEQLADADGAHAEHEHAHEHRNARCDFDGAVFRFETAHGVIQGTAMREVFQAFCDAEFDRDWQWVKDTFGDEAHRSHMPRTAAQRRADAFVALVLAAASAGAGEGRSIDVTVNLISDLEQFERSLHEEVVNNTEPTTDCSGANDQAADVRLIVDSPRPNDESETDTEHDRDATVVDTEQASDATVVDTEQASDATVVETEQASDATVVETEPASDAADIGNLFDAAVVETEHASDVAVVDTEQASDATVVDVAHASDPADTDHTFEAVEPAASSGQRASGIDPATVRDRRCETTDGVPVDPRQLVAAAMLGRVRHIVLDGAGVIVAAGRKRKLFTGALREAITAVDPVCGWLGCNLRAQVCSIDHLEPRSRGGPTDAWNSKIFCLKHNIFKHVAGYAVERQPDGIILITRPDGTLLCPPDAA